MSGPTDVPPVDTSDADRKAMGEAGRSFYGDYIINSHEECSKCVVLILFSRKDDPEKKVASFKTGIIVAAGKESCYIITTCFFPEDHLYEVQFYDGTKRSFEQFNARNETGFSVFVILNVNMDKMKPARFADRAIASCERVFTCGYSSSLNNTSFFSGSITSGVDMKDKSLKKGTLFVHGCATGPSGHLGTAVFNERQSLVGMNLFYTVSNGYNYGKPTQDGGKDADLGGIVSALDLTSIEQEFASLYKMEGKTIHEMMKGLTDVLLLRENKSRGG